MPAQEREIGVPILTIRYEGGLADSHQLNLRHLGRSLIGIERLITIGLFALDRGRAPRRREHLSNLPFEIRASAPKRGSVGIELFLVNLAGDILAIIASKVILSLIGGLVSRAAGKEKDARSHFEKVELERIRLDRERIERDREWESHRHAEVMKHYELMEQRVQVLVKEAVSPVGHSCEAMLFLNGTNGRQSFQVDFEMVRAIRARVRRGQ